MPHPLVLRLEAKEDLRRANEWYESKSEGLGDRFLDAVETAFAKIEVLPSAPAVVYHDVRFMKVSRFPYGVFYRVLDDSIDVVAIVHGNRASRVWKRRLN